jgi:predicted dehydrogenase
MAVFEQHAPLLRVGLLGCGHVSDQYLEGCGLRPELEIVACADTDLGRAEHTAAKAGARALTPDVLLQDEAVDVVLNLTPPALHAGKHVYSEKPLATNVGDGEALVRLAHDNGVSLGCAPDTFLGAPLQTARRLIDEGHIGRPVGAVAFVSLPGYEHFHPDVLSFYAEGMGPALDLGPYYATALVHLLGPVCRVVGRGTQGRTDRRFQHGDRAGESIPIEAPTHVVGLLEFESGVVATMQLSWDIWATTLPYIQIHGTEGSLDISDPDYFEGAVRVRRADADDLASPPPAPGVLPWSTMPQAPTGNDARGAGLADLARALVEGREPIASGRLALHVLEVLDGLRPMQSSFEAVEMRHPWRPPAAVASNASVTP